MSSKVLLYDIPSKQGTAWSLNPWKTRMILNYKGIDYQTEWVEYPDLAPTLKGLGIPPNDKDAPGYYTDYSSPAIKYADGTHAMDSWPIARELERLYPSPSLHLDDPIVPQVRDSIIKLREPLTPHFMPKAPHILLPRSADYFNETRTERFGMTLPELERTKANEQCWEDAKVPAKKIGDLLREKGGPCFLGPTVSYADFIFVSYLQWIKRLDEGDFQRYLTLDPAFSTVYEACEQWLAKED